MRAELVLRVTDGSGPAEALVIDADLDCTCGELADEIARHLGTPAPAQLFRGDGQPLPRAASAIDAGVLHGERLRIASAGSESSGATPSRWLIVAESGPAAGRVWLRPDGISELGRDTTAELPVPDPLVSRRHARLTHNRSVLRVEDLGSANGTRVAEVEDATGRGAAWSVEAGSSRLLVSHLRAEAAAPTALRGGRLHVNRPPRRRPPVERSLALVLPDVARAAERARTSLATALVPLAIGIVGLVGAKVVGGGAAGALGAASLLFLLASPIMALVSTHESRRNARRDHERLEAERLEAIDALLTRIDAYRDALAERLRADHPAPALVAGDVASRSVRLWERRPDDDDFACIRVGRGTIDAGVQLKTIAGETVGVHPDRARFDGRTTIADAPVTVDLRASHLAVVGDRFSRRAALQCALTSLLGRHSPADVQLVLASATDDVSVIEQVPHVDVGAAGASAEPRELRAMCERRGAVRPTERSPALIVVVVDTDVLPTPEMVDVVRLGPSAGVAVIWVCERRSLVPGGVSTILETADRRACLERLDGSRTDIVPDEIVPQAFRDFCWNLASLLDATGLAPAGAMPGRVLVDELLGVGVFDADATVARWRANRRAAPRSILGAAAGGAVSLDLRADGPHALVAGTTGSGKSELLQTLVATLASSLSPERINFVLIDYKGGAAFKDCVGLPHTVGFVTDLDRHLSTRALRSLQAELRHREHQLAEHGAKDLAEMERTGNDAPPLLVVIVDEFAFLKRELPDFVAGLVDIAQRGRSLGVHLVLATQSPSGVIDDQIRANTNARIALRVTAEHDSRDVIGTDAAAQISPRTPGRAMLRLGSSDASPFQSVYVGHRRRAVAGPQRAFEVLAASGRAGRQEAEDDSAPTDLQRMVETSRAAAAAIGFGPLRRPWLPALPAVVRLADLTTSGAGAVAIGLLDDPDRQAQPPMMLDPRAGNVLLVGGPGSGKSTFLETLGVALAQQNRPTDLHLYVLEGARSLEGLAALPHTGAIVDFREAERVEQLLWRLANEIVARRELLARHGVAGIDDLPEAMRRRAAIAHVVLALDGYQTFAAEYADVDNGSLVDLLHRVLADGRSAGIHVVATTLRRSGLPAAVTAAVATTIVLPLADEDEYAMLGVPARARPVAPPAGRALVGELEVQIAIAGRDPAPSARRSATETIGELLRTRDGTGNAPTVDGLPSAIALADLRARSGSAKVIGVAARSGAPVEYSFEGVSGVLVAGPDGSGRSTALSTLLSALEGAGPRRRYLVAPRPSPLRALDGWDDVVTDPDLAEGLVSRLGQLLRGDPDGGPPIVLVIDDGDECTDPMLSASLETVLRRCRDSGGVVLASALTHSVHRSFGGWMSEIRKGKRGIVLQPDLFVDGELFGIRLPLRTDAAFPPGRGVDVRRGTVEIIQIATA